MYTVVLYVIKSIGIHGGSAPHARSPPSPPLRAAPRTPPLRHALHLERTANRAEIPAPRPVLLVEQVTVVRG